MEENKRESKHTWGYTSLGKSAIESELTGLSKSPVDRQISTALEGKEAGVSKILPNPVSIHTTDKNQLLNVKTIAAKSQRIIQKITFIDPKKLHQAGLDRQIAVVLSKQKMSKLSGSSGVNAASGTQQMLNTTASSAVSESAALLKVDTINESTTLKHDEPSPNFEKLLANERLILAKKLLNRKLITKLPTSASVEKELNSNSLSLAVPEKTKTYEVLKAPSEKQKSLRTIRPTLAREKVVQSTKLFVTEVAKTATSASGAEFSAESHKINDRQTKNISGGVVNHKHLQLAHNFNMPAEKLQRSKIAKDHLTQQVKAKETKFEALKIEKWQDQEDGFFKIEIEEDISDNKQCYSEHSESTTTYNIKYLSSSTDQQQNQNLPQAEEARAARVEKQQTIVESQNDPADQRRDEADEIKNASQSKLKTQNRQHHVLQKILKQQQIQQLLQQKKTELEEKQRKQREQYLFEDKQALCKQNVRLSFETEHKKDKLLARFGSRASQPSSPSSSKNANDGDVIPKASIRPKHTPHIPATELSSKAATALSQVSSLDQETSLRTKLKNLVVLEDKVLSQDEKIDLTVFGITEPKLEPPPEMEPEIELSSDSQPKTETETALACRSEAAIKEKKLHDAGKVSVITSQQQTTPAVKQTKRVIVAADKLKLMKEKLSALAKQVKVQAEQQQQKRQESSADGNVSQRHLTESLKKMNTSFGPEEDFEKRNNNNVTYDKAGDKSSISEDPSAAASTITELDLEGNHTEFISEFIPLKSLSGEQLQSNSLISDQFCRADGGDGCDMGYNTQQHNSNSLLELSTLNFSPLHTISMPVEAARIGAIIELPSNGVDRGYCTADVSGGNDMKSTLIVNEIPDSDATSEMPSISTNYNYFDYVMKSDSLPTSEKITPSKLNTTSSAAQSIRIEENRAYVDFAAESTTMLPNIYFSEENNGYEVPPMKMIEGSNTTLYKFDATKLLENNTEAAEGVGDASGGKALTSEAAPKASFRKNINKNLAAEFFKTLPNTELTAFCDNVYPAISNTPLDSLVLGVTASKRDKRKTYSACIISKPDPDSASLSAVDFIAELTHSTQLTENPLLELSQDEINLSASLNMNFLSKPLDTKSDLAKQSASKNDIFKEIQTPDSEMDATTLFMKFFTAENHTKSMTNLRERDKNEPKIETIESHNLKNSFKSAENRVMEKEKFEKFSKVKKELSDDTESLEFIKISAKNEGCQFSYATGERDKVMTGSENKEEDIIRNIQQETKDILAGATLHEQQCFKREDISKGYEQQKSTIDTENQAFSKASLSSSDDRNVGQVILKFSRNQNDIHSMINVKHSNNSPNNRNQKCEDNVKSESSKKETNEVPKRMSRLKKGKVILIPRKRNKGTINACLTELKMVSEEQQSKRCVKGDNEEQEKISDEQETNLENNRAIETPSHDTNETNFELKVTNNERYQDQFISKNDDAEEFSASAANDSNKSNSSIPNNYRSLDFKEQREKETEAAKILVSFTDALKENDSTRNRFSVSQNPKEGEELKLQELDEEAERRLKSSLSEKMEKRVAAEDIETEMGEVDTTLNERKTVEYWERTSQEKQFPLLHDPQEEVEERTGTCKPDGADISDIINRNYNKSGCNIQESTKENTQAFSESTDIVTVEPESKQMVNHMKQRNRKRTSEGSDYSSKSANNANSVTVDAESKDSATPDSEREEKMNAEMVKKPRRSNSSENMCHSPGVSDKFELEQTFEPKNLNAQVVELEKRDCEIESCPVEIFQQDHKTNKEILKDNKERTKIDSPETYTQLEYKHSITDKQSDLEVTDADYSTREDSNYYDETSKEEGEEKERDLTTHRTNRKRLRKTVEDIKRGRRCRIARDETDSEDDSGSHKTIMEYNNEESNEFFGFDENSPSKRNLEESLQRLIVATSFKGGDDGEKDEEMAECEEEKEATAASNEKNIKRTTDSDEDEAIKPAENLLMGSLKTWLTTGKAGQPPQFLVTETKGTLKEPSKIMPLKKRWELAQQRQNETDITDDTSPAHEGDEYNEEGKTFNRKKTISMQQPINKRKLNNSNDDTEPKSVFDESSKKIKFSTPEKNGHEISGHITPSECVSNANAGSVSPNFLERDNKKFPKSVPVQKIEIESMHFQEDNSMSLKGSVSPKEASKDETVNIIEMKQLEQSLPFKGQRSKETFVMPADGFIMTTSFEPEPNCNGTAAVPSMCSDETCNKTPLATECKSESSSKIPQPKKRGRKPKVMGSSENKSKEMPLELSTENALDIDLPTKRGRKPKKFFDETTFITSTPVKTAIQTQTSDAKTNETALTTESHSALSVTETLPTLRKRGRKPKVPSTAVASTNEVLALSSNNTVIDGSHDVESESAKTVREAAELDAITAPVTADVKTENGDRISKDFNVLKKIVVVKAEDESCLISEQNFVNTWLAGDQHPCNDTVTDASDAATGGACARVAANAEVSSVWTSAVAQKSLTETKDTQPARKKRGRPPKLPSMDVSVEKAKSISTSADSQALVNGSENVQPAKKKRGRKPKLPSDVSIGEVSSAAISADAQVPIQGTQPARKKPRRKAKLPSEDSIENVSRTSKSANAHVSADITENVQSEKKKPGRKPKLPSEDSIENVSKTSTSADITENVQSEKKKPGRKPKLPSEDSIENVSKTSTSADAHVSADITENVQSEKKKPGRKPKLPSEDPIENVSRISTSADAHVSADITESVQSEKKKPGRKPKLPSEDPIDNVSRISTSADAHIPADITESSQPERKKRGRKPKLTSNVWEASKISASADEELPGNSSEGIQPARKTPGRKPKCLTDASVEDDSAISTSADAESHDAVNDLNSFNPRLLLIRSRTQLDSSEPLTESTGTPEAGSVKCGLCLANVKKSKWKTHPDEHYGIGWIHGQPAVNVSCRSIVLKTMINYYKENHSKGLRCRICQRVYRSGLGLLSHAENCGLTEEEQLKIRIECEFCKNNYMPLSFPVHQRACPARMALYMKSKSTDASEDVKPIEEVYNNVGRLKRQSLLKAENKLKAIGEELLSSRGSEFEPAQHIVYHPPVCIADYRHRCLEDLQQSGKAFCLQKERCNFTSSDFTDMEKHLEECPSLPKPGYHCLFCKSMKVYQTQELAVEHVRKAHAPRKPEHDFEEEDGSDCKIDSESSTEDEGSSGVDSNEDGIMSEEKETEETCKNKKKKKIKRRNSTQTSTRLPNRKQIYPMRSSNLSLNVLKKWKEFIQQNYSNKILFDYKVENCIIMPDTRNGIVEKLLPHQEVSMKFMLSKADEEKMDNTLDVPETNQQVQWKQLHRFETILDRNGCLNFVGAPIKVLAWAPKPNADAALQYISVAYRTDIDRYTRTLNPKISPTLILIYKINEDATNDEERVRLYYALRIPHGPVHCLEFLPSGGYEPAANRLGLLAVGTAASTDIKVYSLPLKVQPTTANKEDNEEEPETDRKLDDSVIMVDLKPVFVLALDLNSGGSAEDGDDDGNNLAAQCICIKWSQAREHNNIFAGYSNGFVGIWDINANENENLNVFRVDSVYNFLPMNYFFIGERGLRDMALHYDTKGVRWLAVCSLVRRLIIYDLRDMENPLVLTDQMAKNNISSLDWPTMWENFATAMGDAMTKNGECLQMRSPLGVHFQSTKVDQMISGVNQAKYNPWQNIYVSATENGDVVFQAMRELHYEIRAKRTIVRKAMASMEVKCLSGQELSTRKDAVYNSSFKIFEPDYKDLYGLIFKPIVKYSPKTAATFESKNRLPAHHIIRYTRINSLSSNLNPGSHHLIACGFENGLLRILNFKRKSYLN